MLEAGFILCSHMPHKQHQRIIPRWIIITAAIIIVADDYAEKESKCR